MIATITEPKKLNTNITVLDSDYITVDKVLSDYKTLPIELYVRGEKPSDERVKQLASSLIINSNRVVLLEPLNWIELTTEKIIEWGLADIKAGKYWVNGNTRSLALVYLKQTQPDLVYGDILIQEIGIKDSTLGDIFDLQDYFNDETLSHSRFEKVKALATYIKNLRNQGIKENQIAKLCDARKGVTATDIKNAKGFFLDSKYKEKDLSLVLELVKSNRMAFDTAVSFMDIVNNPKNELSAESAIAAIVEKQQLEERDTITRKMVYQLRDDVKKAKSPKNENLNVNGENDPSVLTKPPTEATEAKPFSKEEAHKLIDETVAILDSEVKTIQEEKTEDNLAINYRDSLPYLQNVLVSLSPFIPLDESQKLFGQISQIVSKAIQANKDKMNDEQLVTITKALKKFHNNFD